MTRRLAIEGTGRQSPEIRKRTEQTNKDNQRKMGTRKNVRASF